MDSISYLTQCLKNNKLIRWPAMPLTIFVSPFGWYKAKDHSYVYQQMIFDALKIWEKASNNNVSFKVVSDINLSQINISWRRVNRETLGHCYFNYDSQGRLYSAEISIGLSDGIIHKRYQDKDEVFHTILHEIGHALGLDHSPHKNDIMYVPHQYGVIKLSERDCLTLKWMYNFPHGVDYREILSHYSLTSGYDLDQLIYKLEAGGSEKDVEKFELTEVGNDKDLDQEQKILAEINKYNLSLQNINLPSQLQETIKRNLIKKKFDDK